MENSELGSSTHFTIMTIPPKHLLCWSILNRWMVIGWPNREGDTLGIVLTVLLSFRRHR